MALPGHLPRPILSQDSRMASVPPRINENLAIDALDNAVNGEIRKKDSWCTRMGRPIRLERVLRGARESRVRQSFSRKGCPCDNAVTESFFKTPKGELPLDCKHDARIEARQEIFKFIELHCNTRRPHSSLGNISPVEYERQCAH